jgi:hypothetical protein
MGLMGWQRRQGMISALNLLGRWDDEDVQQCSEA